MRDQFVRQLLEETASEAVPESMNLWPALSSRIEAAHARRNRRWPSRRRLVLVGLAVVVLALSLVAATPAGAAVGRAFLPSGMLQRFGMVLVRPTLVPSHTPAAGRPQAEPKADAPSGPLTPSLTLEEAQQQVSFLIRTPAWLPGDVVYRGALVAPDGTVVVSYRGVDDPSKGMFIQMQQGAAAGGYAVPSSAAQQVRVGGHAAVYARGSWDRSGNWNRKADAGLLSWQQDGMTYVLSSSGLGLSRNDMIRIAESLR